MKNHRYKLIASFLILLYGVLAFSQNGFNYQAALREPDGTPIVDSTFVLTVLILEGNINGSIIYTEEHEVTTNKLGLFNIVIGEGSSTDNFKGIEWGEYAYFLGLKMDGHTFSISRLRSVPYAMHALTAGKLKGVYEPVEKSYTDSLNARLIDLIADPGQPKEAKNAATKGYVDSLAVTMNTSKIHLSGDTLISGNSRYVIPGIQSQNSSPFKQQKCFGGTGDEAIKAILRLPSGNTVIAAETNSHNGDISAYFGMTDVWLFEIDSALNLLWQKSIGGSHLDNITKIILLPNGNLMLGGITESNGGVFNHHFGKFDAWLAEVSMSTHEVIWSENYGGSQTDFLNDMVLLDDGSLIFGGSTFSDDHNIGQNRGVSDIWAMKINSLKTVVWSQTYGDMRFESLHQIIPKNDGHIWFIGETESNAGMVKENNGGLDIWIVETDENGQLINQKCVGTTENDQVSHVIYSDNTLFISGISFALNWDQAGSLSTQNIAMATVQGDLSAFRLQLYGGSQGEWPNHFFRNGVHNLLIGTTASIDGDVEVNHGDLDMWLVSANDTQLEFQKCFGGSYADEGRLIKAIDGGFILAGTSESNNNEGLRNNGGRDIWILKTDENFNIIKQINLGGTMGEELFDITYMNGKLTIFGITQSADYGIETFHGKNGSNSDIWVVKTPF